MTVLLGIATRLRLARLIFVTDARTREGDLEPLATAAVAGGASVIELSDERLDRRAQLAALAGLRRIAARRQALVAVYKDRDIAGEFAADVLHLPDDRSPAKKARRALHEFAVIGRSCRTPAGIDAALDDPDVNYLTVDADRHTLDHAVRAAPPSDPAAKPWFAAGGITLDNLDDVLAAGAARVMVSRAIAGAADPQRAAESFDARLAEAWRQPGMESIALSAFGRGAKPLRGDEAFPNARPKRRDDGPII